LPLLTTGKHMRTAYITSKSASLGSTLGGLEGGHTGTMSIFIVFDGERHLDEEPNFRGRVG
jgi:hypothetical protein